MSNILALSQIYNFYKIIFENSVLNNLTRQDFFFLKQHYYLTEKCDKNHFYNHKSIIYLLCEKCNPHNGFYNNAHQTLVASG
jgi:hypothetical protein